ncbi:hypothetical protein CORC01_11559 [Colletotrichum orchidophilum]|uniref:Uncharacterized protein n=1 Tax=Colletotrichum orchidophilum TaxID=1209926 RepID=A0A1G4AVF5_9PEZI|nr:uncharacterized protein CORC01_11559 [Colletotrichum orchidophilum]OHE93147.1 hypothetical protein CORC01_11559 [Colletotrichum orchidophilum]
MPLVEIAQAKDSSSRHQKGPQDVKADALADHENRNLSMSPHEEWSEQGVDLRGVWGSRAARLYAFGFFESTGKKPGSHCARHRKPR